MAIAHTYKELEVYKSAMDAAMDIYRMTQGFPSAERYSMVDQIRRSSRSICANIAEAWRKRRYRAAFVNRLSDAESEAAETQVWIEFSMRCGYLDAKTCERLDDRYDHIISQLVRMIDDADSWVLRK